MTAPLRRVSKETLRAGQTIFANFHIHWWELTLECDHTVDRRCRYRPNPSGHTRRGWAALHHPPSLDRLIDAPKKVRCEDCGSVSAQR